MVVSSGAGRKEFSSYKFDALPHALAAALHHEVGPDDLLVRADARVDQPLVGA
jgi:hypothetical protein